MSTPEKMRLRQQGKDKPVIKSLVPLFPLLVDLKQHFSNFCRTTNSVSNVWFAWRTNHPRRHRSSSAATACATRVSSVALSCPSRIPNTCPRSAVRLAFRSSTSSHYSTTISRNSGIARARNTKLATECTALPRSVVNGSSPRSLSVMANDKVHAVIVATPRCVWLAMPNGIPRLTVPKTRRHRGSSCRPRRRAGNDVTLVGPWWRGRWAAII